MRSSIRVSFKKAGMTPTDIEQHLPSGHLMSSETREMLTAYHADGIVTVNEFKYATLTREDN